MNSTLFLAAVYKKVINGAPSKSYKGTNLSISAEGLLTKGLGGVKSAELGFERLAA